MRRCLVGALVALVVPTVPGLAQDFTVRITVARANVRSGPSLSSEVVTQVTAGTTLPLRRIEGDWFLVELPPGAAAGGAGLAAYVSNTVAVVEPVAPPVPERASGPAGTPAPVAEGPDAPSAPELLVPRRDGMAVALQIGVSTAWLTPEPATLDYVEADVRSIPELARLLAMRSEGSAATGDPVTFTWTVEGSAAGQIVPDARPSLVAVFKEVPGVRPEDVVPFLVRLAPIGTTGRVVAAVRARRDRAGDRELSWNVMGDLRQAEVPVTRQVIERGAVRLQPSAPLEPGEYAVVMRPRDEWRVPGASVLGAVGEGRLFSWVWGFSVRPVDPR